MMNKVSYFCLQTTVPGTAANAHVLGIVKGLRELGWVVRLHRVRYSGAHGDPPVLVRLLEFLRLQLHAFFELRRLGLVYIRTHFAAFPLALLCKLSGRPVVQELNGPYEDVFIAWPSLGKIRPLIRFLMQRQLRWADALITVTPQLKEWLKGERLKDRVEVIPNAADIELFRPTPNLEFRLPRTYVLFFGALAEWQGVDELIKAVQTPAWPAAVDLVIAGDGVRRSYVEEKSSENPRIRYLGKVPHEKLPQLISGSLAVAVPKNNLGNRRATGLSPIKLYEALGCGVPVIVTDFPGQADLVREHDCGLVVPPGDPGALAGAVGSLYHDSRSRAIMGRNGRAAIAAHHSWQQRAASTARLLARLVR